MLSLTNKQEKECRNYTPATTKKKRKRNSAEQEAACWSVASVGRDLIKNIKRRGIRLNSKRTNISRTKRISVVCTRLSMKKMLCPTRSARRADSADCIVSCARMYGCAALLNPHNTREYSSCSNSKAIYGNTLIKNLYVYSQTSLQQSRETWSEKRFYVKQKNVVRDEKRTSQQCNSWTIE